LEKHLSMSELYASKYIIKILEKNGFVFISKKGSNSSINNSSFFSL